MNNLERAKDNFLLLDETLEKYARKSLDFHRIIEEERDIRSPFSRDCDRIIHSLSYTRYIDKTQVYSFKNNDHIQKRIIHVQFVSKIARTIGRALRLNTDLIEAIALGHDIGHTPLGHFGESILCEISLRETKKYFAHNIQSVRNFLYIENNGKGLNLCIETLDGIMCHNGEFISNIYKPMIKDQKEFLREYLESYDNLEKSRTYLPMTLEGCVVRISDIIAYLGRDIEDAIRLGLFRKSDIDPNIVKVLGDDNRSIVNNIILDIIENSMDKPYIKMSDKVFKAVKDLKKFNYEHIYKLSMDSEERDFYKEGINKLYKKYLCAIKNKDYDDIIYTIFLNQQNDSYQTNTSDEIKVLDFIAGMTDDFLLRQIKELESEY